MDKIISKLSYRHSQVGKSFFVLKQVPAQHNWLTHIWVSKLTIIVSDNGLSPSRRQAIIWTNTGILLIGPLGTNFSEISIEIDIFPFKKMHLKISSGNWQPSCLGLKVLKCIQSTKHMLHVLLCFVVGQNWLFYPYSLWLPHCHWGSTHETNLRNMGSALHESSRTMAESRQKQYNSIFYGLMYIWTINFNFTHSGPGRGMGCL